MTGCAARPKWCAELGMVTASNHRWRHRMIAQVPTGSPGDRDDGWLSDPGSLRTDGRLWLRYKPSFGAEPHLAEASDADGRRVCRRKLEEDGDAEVLQIEGWKAPRIDPLVLMEP